MKIKLFLYDNAQAHSQDEMPGLENVIPFSKAGIEKWCEIVPFDKADYFYMGQFRDIYPGMPGIEPLIENFKYFNQLSTKHIADIEGDWFERDVPFWMQSAILTINSVETDFWAYKLFVRPTFTRFLAHCARNRHETFEVKNTTFAFIGVADPGRVREKMANAVLLSKIKGEVYFRDQWSGKDQVINSPILNKFEEVILGHGIALCPRGCGRDSARFYEACFFGRAPVLIGDNRLLGDNEHDMSFVFKISQYISAELMADKLTIIAETPLSEIQERGRLAREYFDNVFRKYISDPTEFFIKRMIEVSK